MSEVVSPKRPVIVVSGLPRSGTSMMMQLLSAAGVPLLCDDERPADDDNPRGYFEYEPVKRIANDSSWLPKARGKAVKVVSPLLRHLPVTERYRVIFMRRKLDEVLTSQAAMMKRRGEADDLSDRELRAIYETHLAEVRVWLRRRHEFDVVGVDYTECVHSAQGLDALLPWLPATADLAAMRQAVLPSLHHHSPQP